MRILFNYIINVYRRTLAVIMFIFGCLFIVLFFLTVIIWIPIILMILPIMYIITGKNFLDDLGYFLEHIADSYFGKIDDLVERSK